MSTKLTNVSVSINNNKGVTMKKTNEMTNREFVKVWFKENGHLLEKLVEDTPEKYHVPFNETYHSIQIGGRRKGGSPSESKDEQNDYSLRSSEVKHSGYIEWECAACGERFDYEPAVCPACYNDLDFIVNHGPFEGIAKAHSAAITTGDFQGLARSSVFEEGCNFNDVACLDKSGMFVGYMSEFNARDYELKENRWAKFEFELLEQRLKIRMAAEDYVKELEAYFIEKAVKLSKYQDLRALQKEATITLMDEIKCMFGEQSGPYKYGYIYPSVKITNKHKTNVKINGLVFRRFEHNIYLKWAEANNINTNKDKGINVYEEAFVKLMKLLKSMPSSVYDKRDLILNGWFKMEAVEYRNAMKHAGYLKRSTGQNQVHYVVFRALMDYGKKIGA